MIDYLRVWWNKYFSDPEALLMLMVLAIIFVVVIGFGATFAPVFAALGIAYVLDGAVQALQKRLAWPHLISFIVIYVLFLAIVVVLLLWLLPLLSRQLTELIAQLPKTTNQFQQYLLSLPTKYPHLVSKDMVADLARTVNLSHAHIATLGKWFVSASVASLPSIFSWLVYIFLVPLLVLFFLKDKDKFLSFGRKLLPKNRGLTTKIFGEMKQQVGNYLRGKALEMIVVGVVTYIGFWVFGLRYAPLLAFLVGLSVFIPYVGMVLVTIPVAMVGLTQYGLGADFFWMFLVYLVIQAVDGNVLVPLLFSEAVNLHPVAIIVAILFFGSIWGFWGLFFAIPLATLVRSVITGWYYHCNLPTVHRG